MSYNYDYSTQGALGIRDIQFIANNNVPYNAEQLYADRNKTNLQYSSAHRGIQEDLRDNYGYKSDQTSWNKNCEVMHTYKMKKYEKKEKK